VQEKKVMEILKQSLPNILGGLAVIAIVSAAGWVWSQYRTKSIDTSEIISPSDGEGVVHMAQVSGTFSEADANNDLWLVVQPVQDPQYYPQSSGILKQTNQNWRSVAYIGRSPEHNIGEAFIIHLVAISDASSQVFAEYLKKFRGIQERAGLDNLPEETIVLHSISVVRK